MAYTCVRACALHVLMYVLHVYAREYGYMFHVPVSSRLPVRFNLSAWLISFSSLQQISEQYWLFSEANNLEAYYTNHPLDHVLVVLDNVLLRSSTLIKSDISVSSFE